MVTLVVMAVIMAAVIMAAVIMVAVIMVATIMATAIMATVIMITVILRMFITCTFSSKIMWHTTPPVLKLNLYIENKGITRIYYVYTIE